MSTFAIKIVALATMILDHTGFVFDIGQLRYIGRIAFPLYAFLIGEGCVRTSNIRRYLSRLLVFAFISEIPFDLLRFAGQGKYMNDFSNIVDFSAQNVFFTLFFGALAIAVYLKAKERVGEFFALPVGMLSTVICAYAAQFIRSDYGFIGVVIIAFPAIAAEFCTAQRSKIFVKITAVALCLVYIYGFSPPFMWASFISLIFMLSYNGKKGKPLRWVFYLAYPAHMIILFFIWLYL